MSTMLYVPSAAGAPATMPSQVAVADTPASNVPDARFTTGWPSRCTSTEASAVWASVNDTVAAS